MARRAAPFSLSRRRIVLRRQRLLARPERLPADQVASRRRLLRDNNLGPHRLFFLSREGLALEPGRGDERLSTPPKVLNSSRRLSERGLLGRGWAAASPRGVLTLRCGSSDVEDRIIAVSLGYHFERYTYITALAWSLCALTRRAQTRWGMDVCDCSSSSRRGNADSRRAAVRGSRLHPTVLLAVVAEYYGHRYNRVAAALGLDSGSLLAPDLGGTLLYSNVVVFDLGGLCDHTIAWTIGRDQRAFHDYGK